MVRADARPRHTGEGSDKVDDAVYWCPLGDMASKNVNEQKDEHWIMGQHIKRLEYLLVN